MKGVAPGKEASVPALARITEALKLKLRHEPLDKITNPRKELVVPFFSGKRKEYVVSIPNGKSKLKDIFKQKFEIFHAKVISPKPVFVMCVF